MTIESTRSRGRGWKARATALTERIDRFLETESNLIRKIGGLLRPMQEVVAFALGFTFHVVHRGRSADHFSKNKARISCVNRRRINQIPPDSDAVMIVSNSTSTGIEIRRIAAVRSEPQVQRENYSPDRLRKHVRRWTARILIYA